MRTPLALLLGLLRLCLALALLASSAPSQSVSTSSTSTTSTDPGTVVAQAIAAFSAAPVSQVQLSGTARGYAGSSQPTGTFTATLKSTGESTLHLNLGELSRTETTAAASSAPQCQWTGADGVQHDAAQHNCLLPLHWLIPILELQTQSGKLNASVSAGSDQGAAVQTLSLSQTVWDSTATAQKLTQLSNARLSLDASSTVPTSLSFQQGIR